MSEEQSLASTSRPGSPVGTLPDFSLSKPYRFTWDASARKAGPASVSGTSEGRGDYFAYKPALRNFNFSSTSLALGAVPQDWSSAKYGFNAISTLVNSPHKKSAPPKAHASVPPVLPSHLPRVRRKDFDGYLKAIAADWKQFENNASLSREESESFASRLAKMDSDIPVTPRTPRFVSGQVLPPLEVVPSVFFEPDFDLSSPKTFSAVTEQGEGDEETLDPAALAHSIPLIERLSHYADTIELHLIREISIRSSSFFAALTNLNDLQSESSQCLDRVRKLRGMLRDVDDKSAKRGLKIVRLEGKLRNLEEVQDGAKMIHGVGEMLSLARSLANGGEWNAALGVVNGLENLWEPERIQEKETPVAQPNASLKANGRMSKRNSMLVTVPETISEEKPSDSSQQTRLPPFPISSLKAFASLPEHLRTLTIEITTALTSELVNVLKVDLLTQMDASTPSPPSSPSLGDDPVRIERLTALREQLSPLVHGLTRTRSVKDSLFKWREVALAEIRASVKQRLPSSGELDDDSSKSGTAERGVALRTQLKSMSHEEFILLLRTIYGTLLRSIQELQIQNTILQEVLQLHRPQVPSVDFSVIQTDLSDILSSVTELAHTQASKVVSIRAEKHASLDLKSFLSVFNESWDFIVRTETICRRMVVGLRGVIVSQAKSFLQAMHQDRISLSAKLVEEEQWSAVEVSAASQAIANVIIDSAMRDPPDLVISSVQLLDLPSVPLKANGNASEALASSKHLSIEDRKYFAVSATLQMFNLLADYLKIIVNLSLLTTDAVSRVIEFLKAFNSRTCQVVLGAGAMRSAGLKNITAKHLALASQSLSIVIALIPYVRECFRRHLNPKQAVMLVEFDKLKRDYQEHQQEIHAKLIAIMGDRLSVHCKALQTVDWAVSRDGVNDYMLVLVKETVTLHKVLSRYLQESVLEFIMSQVFASINHRLTEEFGKIELPSADAKERLVRDARYLNQQLSGLKNVNISTGLLETFINEKAVPGLPVTESATLAPPVAMPVPGSPQPQKQIPTANERLKGIFRRSSTFMAKDAKEKTTTPPPPSPMLEKQIHSDPQELETTIRSSPPPTPVKSTTIEIMQRAMTPVLGIMDQGPLDERKSALTISKDLPVPLPESLQEEAEHETILQDSIAVPPLPEKDDIGSIATDVANDVQNGDTLHALDTIANGDPS